MYCNKFDDIIVNCTAGETPHCGNILILIKINKKLYKAWGWHDPHKKKNTTSDATHGSYCTELTQFRKSSLLLSFNL